MAIEQGGANLPSIIALLSERQKERDALVAEIGSAETLHQIHVDREAIEAKVQSAEADWRGLAGRLGRRRTAVAARSAGSTATIHARGENLSV